MMATKKKQITFYADDDVAKFLEQLDSGSKTKKINEAIRSSMHAGEQLFWSEKVSSDRLQQLERHVADLTKMMASYSPEPQATQPQTQAQMQIGSNQAIEALQRELKEIDPATLEYFRNQLRALLSQIKATEEQHSFLFDTTVTQSIYCLLLITYVRIVGSQIRFLQTLAAGPMTTRQIRVLFYEPTAKAFPDIYAEWSFENWLSFLINSKLVNRDGNDVCTATPLAITFFKLAFTYGFSLFKPL